LRYKVAVVLGTRPEIIKMSPVIRELRRRKINYFVIHTGQHYSENMDTLFFKELDIAKPKYNLGAGGLPFNKQIGFMVNGIEKIFRKEVPYVCIVQGDTVSVIAGALAAKKLDIVVVHHEAGLRSHDITMPEEINRIITDHISELLCFPTKDALKNLQEEQFNPMLYRNTGNTVVDAVNQNLEIAKRKKAGLLESLKLEYKKYFLTTFHRAENVDKKERLKGIIDGLSKVADKHRDRMIVLPLHPRTKKKIKEFKLKMHKNIKIINPVGYLEFLILEEGAELILSDSGGIQEEASILKVPCVTLRDNTERPETLSAGMNVLAGTNPILIAKCAEQMLRKKIVWKNVFGYGKAAVKIIDAIEALMKKRRNVFAIFRWLFLSLRRNIVNIFSRR